MTEGFVVLRQAIGICQRRPGLWFTAGLMLLPLASVSVISGALGRWSLIPTSLREGWSADLSSLLLGLIQLMALIISSAVVTLAVARTVAGRPGSTSAAWREGLGRIWPAITSSLALILPVIGWGLLFAVPAMGFRALLSDSHPLLARAIGYAGLAAFFLFISVRFVCVYCVAMLERQGGFRAVERTLNLQAKRIAMVAGAVLPVELVRHGLQELADRLLGRGVSLGNDLVNWLLLPLETAVAVLLYVRLRAERDGPDPTALNDQLAS